MGALNDGVTERCGRVRGVIHEMWIVDRHEHPAVKDLEIVGGAGLQVRLACGGCLPRGTGHDWLLYTCLEHFSGLVRLDERDVKTR